jgi:hypothetical protein
MAVISAFRHLSSYDTSSAGSGGTPGGSCCPSGPSVRLAVVQTKEVQKKKNAATSAFCHLHVGSYDTAWTAWYTRIVLSVGSFRHVGGGPDKRKTEKRRGKWKNGKTSEKMAVISAFRH